MQSALLQLATKRRDTFKIRLSAPELGAHNIGKNRNNGIFRYF
jgi:hypothetical protein